MKRLRSAWQGLQQTLFKSEEIAEVEQKYDFKGQKIRKDNSISPRITREQVDQFSRLEPELKMQSREIRVKNVLYMTGYLVWFTGCVMFIMYRLKTDDLELMEKEAESRIKLREDMKKLRAESSSRLQSAVPKEF